MSDIEIYDRTGELKHPDKPTVQPLAERSDPLLFVSSNRSNAICQFLVAPENHEMYVHYHADRIEPSLNGLYHDIREKISETGWTVHEDVPEATRSLLPRLAGTEPKSFGDFPNEDPPSLDLRVIDHLARSNVDKHLNGDYEPEGPVLVGVGTYEEAVQVAKYVLDESCVGVAITESPNADIVDDADLVLVYEPNFELRPLNPVVLRNGLIDLLQKEIDETVTDIKRADASPMGRFHSLSAVRSLVVDDGWELDIDRNVAHEATIGIEDTIEALEPRIPDLPRQTEEDIVGRIEASMMHIVDSAMEEFLEALEEYAKIVEESDGLGPADKQESERLTSANKLEDKLEEILRCVRLLETIEEGKLPPETDHGVSVRYLEWNEAHPLLDALLESSRFDWLSELILAHPRLIRKYDSRDQIETTREDVEEVAGELADEIEQLALEALEETTEDQQLTEKHGQYWRASLRLEGLADVSRLRRLYLQLRHPGAALKLAANESDDLDDEAPIDEEDEEFSKLVEVLSSHANHEVVAEHLQELEEDVESRREILVKDCMDSVQKEAESFVDKAEEATSEGIPGRKIATELDDELSQSRFTVKFKLRHRQRMIILVGTSLLIGLAVGVYWIQ